VYKRQVSDCIDASQAAVSAETSCVEFASCEVFSSDNWLSSVCLDSAAEVSVAWSWLRFPQLPMSEVAATISFRSLELCTSNELMDCASVRARSGAVVLVGSDSVSYTHLDVYKRQFFDLPAS